MTTALYRLLSVGLAGAAVLAVSAAPDADRPKRKIEAPAEGLVAKAAAPAPAADGFVNPKVEPGKVKWHADFGDACKAAAASGKPVLLFQMMGNLDEQFC
jgi:hypothetical protein